MADDLPAGDNTLEAKRRLGTLGWEMDLLVVDPPTTSNEGHHFRLVGIAESVAFIRKHTGIP